MMISDNSYLWALKLERNETLHIHVQHGKLLQRVQCQSHWRRRSSWMWRMLGQKVRSTCRNAVRHDGQLVTPFYGVSSWPCDESTGSLGFLAIKKFPKRIFPELFLVVRGDIPLHMSHFLAMLDFCPGSFLILPAKDRRSGWLVGG